ncbi:MAG TPA: GNAT family protein [Thermoleophilaceae bacterium]|nr:GNAT family protein [Thermoleophilaceae bacterium]
MESWPLFSLELRTPRLSLRLGRDEEIDRLARASVGRVLPAEQAVFMDSDWTQLPSPEYERSFVQFHWRARADWRPGSWSLQLFGFDGDEPVGGSGLVAEDFATRRSVRTGSWLLPDWRGRGLGKEGRAALLELAFGALGARESVSDAHPDNPASLGVSLALGYERTGMSTKVGEDGKPRERINVRLPRERWEETHSIPVTITGIDACRDLFGVESPANRGTS